VALLALFSGNEPGTGPMFQSALRVVADLEAKEALPNECNAFSEMDV